MPIWISEPSKKKKLLYDDLNGNTAEAKQLIHLYKAHVKLLKWEEKIQLDQILNSIQISTLVNKFIYNMEQQLALFQIDSSSRQRIRKQATIFRHEQQESQYELKTSSITILSRLVDEVNKLATSLSLDTALKVTIKKALVSYLTCLKDTLEDCQVVLIRHQQFKIPILIRPKDFQQGS
ncbi:MAG: hypothetical protein ACX932_01290 [Gammaproteobacteria bacterium]